MKNQKLLNLKSCVAFALVAVSTLILTFVSTPAWSSAERSVDELRHVLALPELRARVQGHQEFDAVLRHTQGYDMVLGDCSVSVLRRKANGAVTFVVGPLICN